MANNLNLFTTEGEKPMSPTNYSNFIDFLQKDLSLSAASIDVALRYREQNPGPLPMILWQYGLVTLDQLNQIYDWLESAVV